jgi:Zn-dependent protease
MFIVPLLTALTQGWAIGWASTPYDPRWAAAYPRREALMAAAGPAGNLLIALAALLALRTGLALGWFAAPPSIGFEQLVVGPEGAPSFAGTLLSIFLMLNILLAVFNLIPLPPLDGASILGILLPRDQSRRMRELSGTPMFQLAGLLVAWRVFPLIVRPLFSGVIQLVHPTLSYS